MSKRPPEEPASRKVGYPIGVVGHLSACLLPLGLLFRSLGSPLVIQVPLLRSLGSRLVASAPRRCELAPPKVPQRPVQGPKCTILCGKTNDFAMPPVLQKWSVRVPLGPPKVAPRLPQGPPRATPSPPRTPPGAFGGALPPPEGPPRPPQEHLRADKGGKRNQWFYCNKTYISAQGGGRANAWQGFRALLGSLLFLRCSFRLVFGSLGAPRFRFTCSAPLLAASLPPQGPPTTRPRAEMYHFM